MRVSDIFIYPVKSLGGIRKSGADVTERGLENDRRWMIVDEAGRFITQRQVPKMATLSLDDRPQQGAPGTVSLRLATPGRTLQPAWYTVSNDGRASGVRTGSLLSAETRAWPTATGTKPD